MPPWIAGWVACHWNWVAAMGVYPPVFCWFATHGGSHGVMGTRLDSIPPLAAGHAPAGWMGPQFCGCCCCCCWGGKAWVACACCVEECCCGAVASAGSVVPGCRWFCGGCLGLVSPAEKCWWFIPTVWVRTVKVHRAAAACWCMLCGLRLRQGLCEVTSALYLSSCLRRRER